MTDREAGLGRSLLISSQHEMWTDRNTFASQKPDQEVDKAEGERYTGIPVCFDDKYGDC